MGWKPTIAQAEAQSSLRLPSLLSTPRKDVEHIEVGHINLPLYQEVEQSNQYNQGEYHHGNDEYDERGPTRTQTMDSHDGEGMQDHPVDEQCTHDAS